MKNKLWLIAIIGFLAACSNGNDGITTVPVTGVTLDQKNISLTVGETANLTATIAPDNATNKAVSWSSGNEAKATVSDGVVTAVAEGTAVITVTTADGNKTDTCTVTISGSGKTPISVAEISITAPVNGGTPATTVNSEAERFTAGTVTWSPNDNPFQPNMEYTATVTLTAESGFTFTGINADQPTVNGTAAAILSNTGETVTLSHKFPATGTKIVSSIAIKSQPNNMSYAHGDKVDLSGMVVTLTYDDNTTKDVASADFEANGITANPSQGAHLEHSEYDGKQITITYGNLTPLKTTGNLIVTAIPVSVLIIDAIPAQTFTGSPLTPSVTVKHTVEGSTRTLAKDTDYTVAYSNNINVGTATVTITGKGDYTGSRNVTFTINAAIPQGGAPQITTTALPHGAGDRAYSQTLTATGDTPITWSVEGTLPDGLSLNGTTGIISGTPTNYKNNSWRENTYRFTFTAKATNSAGNAEKQFSIIIARTFTSPALLLDDVQYFPANTADNPYLVALNVTSMTSFGNTWFSGRYVILDLSDSTFTSISDNAFLSATNLTSVILPNSVTSIGNYAFSGCTSLASIVIPNNVTSIGNSAFSGCTSLASITIGNNVTSIGSGAFSNCTSLTSINISNNVTNIGELAFQGCTSLTAITVDAGNSAYSSQDGILYNKNKTSLVAYPSGKTGNTFTIPAGVNSIEIGAFSGCSSLTAINVDAGNSTYISDNGVLYNKAKTTLVTYPSGKTGSFTIPNSVNSIEAQAFSGCTSLTSITISNSVTSIGASAFRYCANLTSVTIPNSVNTIGAGAFSDCTYLASITFQGTIAGDKLGVVLPAPINITISPFSGDLRDRYLANGTGTYTTTAPVNNTSVWARQQQ